MMPDIVPLTNIVIRAASDNSDNNSGKLGLILMLAGFVFYGAMYLRYRNTDKRDHYESETKAETANMEAQDAFSRSLTHLKNSRMSGANNTSVRGARAGGLSSLTGGVLPKGLNGILPKEFRGR